MPAERYENAGASVSTPTALKRRKEVRVKLDPAKRYSERLLIIDPVTGESASHKIVLTLGGETVERTSSGNDGAAPRRVQEDPEQLHALIGPSGEWSVEYHFGENRLPLAYQEEPDDPDASGVFTSSVQVTQP